MLEFLGAYPDLASLVVRVLVGALMVVHGYPKVFSKEARSQMIPMMKGMGVPRIGFESAALLETFGGLLLILGLLTRLMSIFFVRDDRHHCVVPDQAGQGPDAHGYAGAAVQADPGLPEGMGA